MDERIINWILENGSQLLNLVLAILAIVVAIVQNWTSVKAKAYESIAMAKKLAKDEVLKSGQEQEDWVVKTAYPLLPAQVRLFVSESTFRTIVKKLYDAAKASLSTEEVEGGGAVAGE